MVCRSTRPGQADNYAKYDRQVIPYIRPSQSCQQESQYLLHHTLSSSQLVIGHMRQRSFFLHVPPKCLQRKVWCPPTAFFDGLVFYKILACSFIPPYDAVDDNDKYTNR